MIPNWRSYLAPKHWTTWLVVGLFKLISWLPFRWQMSLGKLIGAIAHRTMKSRRKIVERNLEICFPALDASEQAELVKQHFDHLGKMLVETCLAWWASDQFLYSKTTFHGVEHVQTAIDSGKGILCLTAHMGPIDLGGRLITRDCPRAAASYRPDLKRPLITDWLHYARTNYSGISALSRDDIKGMLRHLKAGNTLWYGPDQDIIGGSYVFVPFFGQQTNTTMAISKLAGRTDSVILPYHAIRKEENGDIRYEIHFEAPWTDAKTSDELTIATRYNAMVERWATANPAQYYWVHKRFKTRPEGESSLY